VSGLAVFPDGRRVLISLSGPTFVWDLETNRQLRQAPGFGESIALSTDGLRALIGGGNFMRLWDLVTGDELVREDHKRAVRHVAFSSDDCQALSSTDESVHVWALPPGRAAGEQPPVVEVAEFPRHGGIHLSVDVSRDGRWVLTGDWPNSVRLWDREKGQLIREFNQGGRPITSVAFSRDGTLALAGGDDGVVRLWDLRSGEHRELTRHVDHVMSVAFSPDGRRAYSAGGILPGLKDGTDFAVRVWDLETGQQLRPFEGHKAAVWSVAVSPDGRYVLSGGNDAVPILWDARTGREIHRLKGHADRVVCVAFLPDGRVVSSGDDGTIRLWDVENGREFLGHFKDPTGLTEPLAVSRDGHRLFSSGEHQLRYWNLDTGRLIQKLKWEESPVGGSFTPDGRHVVWGGWGSLLRMYRLADIPERPIAPPRRSPNTKSRSGLKPTEEASHTDLAKALRGQGKLEEAIAEYKTAIGINPDDANPHNGLGNALHKQGKLAEAIAEYREALRLKPEFADAYRNLGKALQDQGLLAEAIIEYKAIQLKPDDALAHSRLGYALHAQGSLAEAIIKYKEAIRLKPDDAKTLNNLAWALVLYPKRPRPDYDEALMHSRRAVELAPDWANLNTLALAEYRSGHWAESLAASERSMALNNGGNAWDWFLEAMARCQKGDKDEARKWLDTAVASDPKTKNVELRQFWAEAAELLGRSGPGASAAGSPAAPAAEKPR